MYILLTRGCFTGKPKALVSIQPDPHVYLGETVTLRCDIQGGGDTEWTYSWHKNNNRLDSEEFITDNAMQEFSIWLASDSDSGDYTCRGQSNDSQSSELSDAVTLTVSGESVTTTSGFCSFMLAV